MKIGYPGANRQDLAGSLIAGDERQAWRFVEAGAVVDVDEVQADGVLADANLAGPRRGHVHGFVNQGLRPPHLVHAHRLGHQFLLALLDSNGKLSRPRCQHGTAKTLPDAYLTAFLRLRLASTLKASTAAENAMAK